MLNGRNYPKNSAFNFILSGARSVVLEFVKDFDKLPLFLKECCGECRARWRFVKDVHCNAPKPFEYKVFQILTEPR
jgi:hypothetical protein